jgi:hypothetical protein
MSLDREVFALFAFTLGSRGWTASDAIAMRLKKERVRYRQLKQFQRQQKTRWRKLLRAMKDPAITTLTTWRVMSRSRVDPPDDGV